MAPPLLTPLLRITGAKGDVLRGVKSTDPGFEGFGEAYFSMVASGAIKGWKRHREMTLNLICAYGAVRFVVHDGQANSTAWLDTILSPDRPDTYQRLTVPPMLWVAFQGLVDGQNLILNVASQPHDPNEQETVDLAHFAWPENPVCGT